MSAAAYDPDELKRPQFDEPALAEPALTSPEQPYSEPALALAPEQRGGPAPTNALALEQGPGIGRDANGDVYEGPEQAVVRPPPPGGALTTDQLMTAASGPPAGGGDAVDREIAANPIPTGPGAPPAKPPTVQAQEQEAMGEQRRLADDAERAERAAGAARAKQAEAAQAEAVQKAKLEAENAARQQAIVDQANQRTQQWMDRSAAETDKYMRMGLHDYFDNKGAVGGTVSKILAGLATFAGAAGGRSLAENPGYQMINTAIERDFRQQQAGIAKQKENVDLARGQVAESISQKQQALADNNLKKAAAFDAAAAQALAYKLKQGVPLEQAQTDAAIVGLRQKANAVRMETLKAVHGQNVQDAQLADADERIGMEHERVGIEREQLKNDTTRANAAMIAAQARGKKGKGGGGGGGGRADAMGEFVTAAGSLEKGQPITPDVAKLALRAGLKPNQIAGEVDKYRGSGAKSAKGDTAGDRLTSKEADKWAAENGLTAIVKKQTELSSVLDEINNAPHNPLQQALAVEKAVSSARGGAASKQALELALKHLGGRWDSIQAMVQGAENGELGQKQMDNFIGFMRNQLGTAQKEGKDKYDDFDKYVESQPENKRGALTAQRGRLFSGLSGFGGTSHGGGGGGKALPGGNKLVKVRDQKTGEIIEALKTPGGVYLDKQTGQRLE